MFESVQDDIYTRSRKTLIIMHSDPSARGFTNIAFDLNRILFKIIFNLKINKLMSDNINKLVA